MNWYEKLSQRERLLIILVGSVLFILFNLFFVRFALSNLDRLQTVLKTRTEEWKTAQLLLEDKELWAKREAWIREKQPALTNESEANVQLMREVESAARANEILIQNPEVHPVDNQPYYTCVSVSVNTTSSWESLVKFLHQVSKPESFLVVETANLETEPNDPKQMRGRFKISRWYAPRG